MSRCEGCWVIRWGCATGVLRSLSSCMSIIAWLDSENELAALLSRSHEEREEFEAAYSWTAWTTWRGVAETRWVSEWVLEGVSALSSCCCWRGDSWPGRRDPSRVASGMRCCRRVGASSLGSPPISRLSWSWPAPVGPASRGPGFTAVGVASSSCDLGDMGDTSPPMSSVSYAGRLGTSTLLAVSFTSFSSMMFSWWLRGSACPGIGGSSSSAAEIPYSDIRSGGSSGLTSRIGLPRGACNMDLA